jgi:hypothetical protein
LPVRFTNRQGGSASTVPKRLPARLFDRSCAASDIFLNIWPDQQHCRNGGGTQAPRAYR